MYKKKLFLDESGKASLLSQDQFILTGVVIEQRYKTAVEGYFNFIKGKYNINLDSPYHSYHIYEHPHTKLSDSTLTKLSSELSDFISNIPVEIKILGVNKKIFKDALGVKSDDDFKGSAKRNYLKEFPYLITFSYMLEWFAGHIDNPKVIGEIVADSRRTSDKNLIDALDMSQRPECVLNKNVKDIIRNKCTAIRFATKYYLSGGLELTDYISYTSFFKARRMLNEVKVVGLDKVWKKIKIKLDDGDIYTLTKKDIQRYFKVDEDGHHQYLK